MKKKLVVYWSRRDLRLRDNSALFNAVSESKKTDSSFLPVFIIEPYMIEANPDFQFGLPSRYFLSQAVPKFAENFEEFLLISAKPASFFKKLSQKYDLDIYVNEDVHTDFYIQVDRIKDSGIQINIFRDQLTVSRETKTSTGKIYSVFTPFKKAVWDQFIKEDEEKNVNLKKLNWFNLKNISYKKINVKDFNKKEILKVGKHILDISDFDLPKRDLSNWYFCEKDALKHFDNYLNKNLANYDKKRNFLDEEGTSKMSLALTWGLVSSRTLVNKIKNKFSVGNNQGAQTFISELIWREFYKYLWFHYPSLIKKPFQEKYEKISWINDSEALKRFKVWIKGETGYPVVDAAMMQLAKTGWMHNRARMIVASVLTKNLGVNWVWGQEYFRAMLLDLDESSNNGGWQWAASVGADPKPIRIFNPYLQAKNYDSENIYQNKWLSEKYLENPPEPIVPHEKARKEALDRYGL